jgi:hypothetical protein
MSPCQVEFAAIEREFEENRFSMEPVIYADLLRRLLALDSTCRCPRMQRFYELVEGCLEMIYHAHGAGTLTSDDRDSLLGLFQVDWRADLDNETKRAMIVGAGVLIPHEGARTWLRQIAAEVQDPEYRNYILQYANLERDEPVV